MNHERSGGILNLDGVRAHGRVHVEAVADHDHGPGPGRDDGDEVRGGDPAARLGLHAPRGRVVHLLAAHRPPDLGGRVRVVRGAGERHHVADPRLRRPVDHHVRGRELDGDGDLRAERLLALDVGGGAAVHGVVVGRVRREGVGALRDGVVREVLHVHGVVVLVPDELRQRVAAAALADELQLPPALHHVAVEALDVRRPRRIEHGERDGGLHRLAVVDGVVLGLARVVGAVVLVRRRQPDPGRDDELAGARAPGLGHDLRLPVLAVVQLELHVVPVPHDGRGGLALLHAALQFHLLLFRDLDLVDAAALVVDDLDAGRWR